MKKWKAIAGIGFITVLGCGLFSQAGEIQDAEVSPELKECREFLGDYFNVSQDQILETEEEMTDEKLEELLADYENLSEEVKEKLIKDRLAVWNQQLAEKYNSDLVLLNQQLVPYESAIDQKEGYTYTVAVQAGYTELEVHGTIRAEKEGEDYLITSFIIDPEDLVLSE